MFKLSLAVLLLAFGQYASAQVIGTGRCPSVTIPQDFDLSKYVGTWFEYAKYPFQYETNLKCNTATYGDAGNNTVSVRNVGINSITGEEEVIEGYAKVLGPAELAVVFFPGQSEHTSNYEVLGSDYVNYAVVYTCVGIRAVHTEFLWILTREAHPSEATLKDAYRVIANNNVSEKQLVKTVQDC